VQFEVIFGKYSGTDDENKKKNISQETGTSADIQSDGIPFRYAYRFS
jgi:hypothetical protein